MVHLLCPCQAPGAHQQGSRGGQTRIEQHPGGLDAHLGAKSVTPPERVQSGKEARPKVFETGIAVQTGVHKAGRILWVVGGLKEGGFFDVGGL